jgi:acyl carrier protein
MWVMQHLIDTDNVRSSTSGSGMNLTDDVKIVLRDTLQLGDRIDAFDASTPLFGSVPELDSMAVVSVVTALEERFDFVVDDDEITAEVFDTVGSLSHFVEQKLGP